MTSFNVGDLVEARKGETAVLGRVGLVCGSPGLLGAGWRISSLNDEGFTVSLVEAATPPLPTEPGFYKSRTGGLWQISERDYPLVSLTNELMCPDPEEFAPFTRLESVPVTAKKVLDAINANRLSGATLASTIGNLRKQFGVSDV